ncbi:MAG TPA: hypothetical protein VMM13_01105 [Euzebya sp.]|nr:hypothetical protein [Euzebya sp.]
MSRVQDFGPAPLDEPNAYPGMWPTGAVMVDQDEVVPILSPLPALMSEQGRTAVMAYGANACPAQLARKELPGQVVLTPTVLRNHLVVYADHVTAYGAVPATVVRWPGASCSVFVLWLTPAQHLALDVTEGGRCDRVLLPTDHGLVVAYRARTGFTASAMRQPIRLAAVSCSGQGLPPAMSQAELGLHRRAMAG